MERTLCEDGELGLLLPLFLSVASTSYRMLDCQQTTHSMGETFSEGGHLDFRLLDCKTVRQCISIVYPWVPCSSIPGHQHKRVYRKTDILSILLASPGAHLALGPRIAWLSSGCTPFSCFPLSHLTDCLSCMWNAPQEDKGFSTKMWFFSFIAHSALHQHLRWNLFGFLTCSRPTVHPTPSNPHVGLSWVSFPIFPDPHWGCIPDVLFSSLESSLIEEKIKLPLF
jgi:hypothetical protein